MEEKILFLKQLGFQEISKLNFIKIICEDIKGYIIVTDAIRSMLRKKMNPYLIYLNLDKGMHHVLTTEYIEQHSLNEIVKNLLDMRGQGGGIKNIIQ